MGMDKRREVIRPSRALSPLVHPEWGREGKPFLASGGERNLSEGDRQAPFYSLPE